MTEVEFFFRGKEGLFVLPGVSSFSCLFVTDWAKKKISLQVISRKNEKHSWKEPEKLEARTQLLIGMRNFRCWRNISVHAEVLRLKRYNTRNVRSPKNCKAPTPSKVNHHQLLFSQPSKESTNTFVDECWNLQLLNIHYCWPELKAELSSIKFGNKKKNTTGKDWENVFSQRQLFARQYNWFLMIPITELFTLWRHVVLGHHLRDPRSF